MDHEMAKVFMPHGMCYLWQPSLIAAQVVTNGLIALAYFSIPLLLLYFIGQGGAPACEGRQLHARDGRRGHPARGDRPHPVPGGEALDHGEHLAPLDLMQAALDVFLRGGAIGVESEPGRGSTFWFTLPLCAGSSD